MSILVQIGICLGVLLVINFFMLIWAFRILSDVFSKRFDSLLETIKAISAERDENIKEAFDERDQRFARLQAIMSQTIIRDTQLFDSMLEDAGPEEEIADEYPTTDPNGA